MLTRAWRYEDIKQIAALEAECFGGEKWSYEAFAASFQQDGFFGVLTEEISALGEETIVAYACVESVLDECDLATIAVRESYRGQGLADKLLSEVEKQAFSRSIKKMFLQVRKDNVVAQRLYEKHNFIPVGVIKKYYPNGVDAIQMVKELTPST